MLRKPQISAGLMGLLARKQTLPVTVDMELVIDHLQVGLIAYKDVQFSKVYDDHGFVSQRIVSFTIQFSSGQESIQEINI